MTHRNRCTCDNCFYGRRTSTAATWLVSLVISILLLAVFLPLFYDGGSRIRGTTVGSWDQIRETLERTNEHRR